MAMHFRLQSHAFFLLAFLAFYASSCEQEDIWRMKLPKVPMPQAIKENLLHANAMGPITIDTKEKLANFDKPYTAKKDKIVASENQPFTVFGWRYNSDTDANAVKPVTDAATTNVVTTKKDKTVASENQPFTVFGWRYNPDTDANAVELVSDAATTNAITTKKDKTVASENQPFTVFGWRYNPDTDVNAVEPVSDAATTNVVTTKKDKTVASENQPYTVFAWHYNPDNINEKNSIKASHNHHHHFTHNANSKDSEVKEENSNGGSVFFVEESLRLGMKLKHDFQKTKRLPYLPKKIAQSIPFSVDKVAEILNLFSIKSESAEATAIKETLGVCLQRPKVQKENRTCAQSMEDIVDFVVKELGTNDVQLRMMRNNIEVPNGIQDYVVTKVKKLVVPGNTAAACHRMSYPYVVYYCHHQQDIGHYDITLVSPTSGNAIQTTAVCHYDTYAWQPDVEALRYLGIRPGDAPVCHFSAINDMFWSIKPTHSKYLDMAQ